MSALAFVSKTTSINRKEIEKSVFSGCEPEITDFFIQ